MRHLINIIDAHVAGEPLRLITGGLLLKGSTILEKRECMMKHYDFIRSAAMLEPRGHADMYGAVLTEPTDPLADLGIIFIDTALYNNMCGHGSIAIGTIAVETGLVSTREPVTDVVIETPAGLVTVSVEVNNGRIRGAMLRGVPSFLFKGDIPLTVFERQITVDIAYGGNFFAIVDIAQLGLIHSPEILEEYIRFGSEIRLKVNEQIDFCHPEKPHINIVDDVLFVGKPAFPGDTHKSLCFLGKAQIDRSPCGTGTCARMAVEYSRGGLRKGELFYHESVIGTVFEGVVLGETCVGSYPAIIPAVRGRAFIISMGTLFLDDDDQLKNGFTIR